MRTKYHFLMLFFVSFFSLRPSQGQDLYNLTDEEIAAIVITTNENEVEWAKVALDKSRNQDVRDFADKMIKDHGYIMELAKTALPDQLNIIPQKNDISTYLEDTRANTIQYLKNRNDRDFDLAYMDNEIEYHKMVIENSENIVIPQIKNPDFNEATQKLIRMLKEHLQTAKEIREKLSN